MKTDYDFSKGKRGAVVQAQPNTTRITLQLNDEVLEWFRNQVNVAGGGNYQRLINDALKQHIHNQSQPLEKVVRRVVREELRNAKPTRLNRTAVAAK